MSNKLSYEWFFELFTSMCSNYDELKSAFEEECKKFGIEVDEDFTPTDFDLTICKKECFSVEASLWLDYLLFAEGARKQMMPAGPSTRWLNWVKGREISDFIQSRLTDRQREYGLTPAEDHELRTEHRPHMFALAVFFCGADEQLTSHGIKAAKTVNFGSLKKILLSREKKADLVGKLPHDDFTLTVEIFDFPDEESSDYLGIFLRDDSNDVSHSVQVTDRGDLNEVSGNIAPDEQVLRDHIISILTA